MKSKNGSLGILILVAAIMFIAPAVFGDIVPGDYTHLWDFESGSGDAIDSVGTANAGVVDGAGYTADALYGNYSLELDGVGGKMDTWYGNVAFGDNFSISMFLNVRSNGEAGGGRIFSTQPGNDTGMFACTYDDKFLVVTGSSATGTETIEIGAITFNQTGFLTMTVSAVDATTSNFNFYFDGQLVLSQTAFKPVSSAIAGEERFIVGNEYSNVRTFDGVIDEVAIFNRDLTGTEVTELYNSLIPEPATMLLLGFGGIAGLIRRKK